MVRTADLLCPSRPRQVFAAPGGAALYIGAPPQLLRLPSGVVGPRRPRRGRPTHRRPRGGRPRVPRPQGRLVSRAGNQATNSAAQLPAGGVAGSASYWTVRGRIGNAVSPARPSLGRRSLGRRETRRTLVDTALVHTERKTQCGIPMTGTSASPAGRRWTTGARPGAPACTGVR